MKIVERIHRYKYLPFDERSLQIITEGTIKFTSPSNFNDPFDCAPDFEKSNIAEYLNTYPDSLKKMEESLKLSSAQLIKEKPAMIRRLEMAIEKGVFGQYAVSDKVGICSLTRDPLNLLMWAHYAQHHTGFVVEFDIPVRVETYKGKPTTDQLLEWLVPQRVEYHSSKPVANLLDDKDTMTTKQFLIKGEDWSYEQEERVIDYVRGHGIHRYDRATVLYSVIAGMKMNNEKYKTLMECVNKVNHDLNLKIEIFKAQPVKGRFELFVPTRSDLIHMKQNEHANI